MTNHLSLRSTYTLGTYSSNLTRTESGLHASMTDACGGTEHSQNSNNNAKRGLVVNRFMLPHQQLNIRFMLPHQQLNIRFMLTHQQLHIRTYGPGREDTLTGKPYNISTARNTTSLKFPDLQSKKNIVSVSPFKLKGGAQLSGSRTDVRRKVRSALTAWYLDDLYINAVHSFLQHYFLNKFRLNLLNGRISEVRTRAKRNLLRR